ncbi:MAG TPA: hypothetical protein VK206_16235 [Anaerolineales bacterium]|nr:hypothetical protein [Anaerolineales bacterium]
MDSKNIRSILQDALEKKIPSSQIHLWPAVQAILVAGKDTSFQQGKKVIIRPHRRSRLALVTLMIIALLALVLLTPHGRAWAQEVVQFFKRINSTTVQLSNEETKQINDINEPLDLPLVPVFIPTASPDMAGISGCETPQKAQSYHCQVALAGSKLGFDLKEFPQKPSDWELKSLSFNTDLQMAAMSYELDIRHISGISYSSFEFAQGRGNFSNPYGNNPWDAVPADKVEPVSIGSYQGEYVKGGFGLPSASNTLIWFEDDRQRLVWSEGARWYLFDFRPNLNVRDSMGKDDLIHLAESLVTSPVATTEPLNPAYLVSISDAEKISGLDLKAPTLLPLNINFSYVRYSPSGKQVHLIYGDNEELIIQEQEGEAIRYTFPVVKVNGEDAYFDTTEGSESHLFLWWHKDGLNYQMDFNQSFGEHIDKEKMISIAESMQDIDDFQKESGGYFEQVALYEQALGMEIKRFSETPAGWIFANFWDDPYTQCITLNYTADTGQGTLSVGQCKTDKRSDVSVFPLKSIEQVQVKDSQAQYIVGDFVTTNDGKQIWDPTAPRKQLYWQEDGLWIQISIYGESGALLDKKDLISIAESLH